MSKAEISERLIMPSATNSATPDLSNSKKSQNRTQSEKLSAFDEKFGLKVTILSGHHKGAKIAFAAARNEPIIAGSSINNDIVMLSADIEDSHLSILPGNMFDGKISISSKTGSVTLKNGRVISMGQQVELLLPTEISFGSTSILIERGPGIKQVKKLIKPVFLVALSLFVGLVGSIIISSLGNTINNSIINKANMATQSTLSISEQNLFTQSKTANQIREQIAGKQLDTFLSVSESSDGTVTVSGNLPKESMPIWRSVLQWYDSQANLAYLVNNVSSKTIIPFELSIKSVWLDGNDRVVILSDGQMARIGDPVKGSWVVKDILDDHITLTRNNESVKITY